MDIQSDILGTLGNTPLVALRRYHPEGALLAAKLEFFNPGASVKDRIGITMIEAAEREGKLRPGMTVVEPTSGNTGLGLAMACVLRGYKLDLHGDHEDLEGEDRPARGARRPGDHLPGGRRRRRPALLLQGRRAHPRRRGRLPSEPVPQRRQPGDALPDHRPGDLAPDRRQGHPLGGGRRHRRHDLGRLALPQGAEPGDPHDRRRPGGLRLRLLERARPPAAAGGARLLPHRRHRPELHARLLLAGERSTR